MKFAVSVRDRKRSVGAREEEIREFRRVCVSVMNFGSCIYVVRDVVKYINRSMFQIPLCLQAFKFLSWLHVQFTVI